MEAVSDSGGKRMSFIEDIENFIQNPGVHASKERYGEMKATLEYMKQNAVGIKNAVATDRIIDYLHSQGYNIGKEEWQIEVLGYLRDNGIFIGSKIAKGMFVINSKKDAKETYTSMKKRVEKENERIRILEKRAKQAGYNL